MCQKWKYKIGLFGQDVIKNMQHGTFLKVSIFFTPNNGYTTSLFKDVRWHLDCLNFGDGY